MTVPVLAQSPKSELDRLAGGGKSRQRVLGLVDQGPRIVAPPAERRHRGLGADQPDGPAVGELERLAVEHGGHRGGLRRRQIAGPGWQA
jgi:hypothetical protein